MIHEADTDWHDCRHGLPPEGVTVEVGKHLGGMFTLSCIAKRNSERWADPNDGQSISFTPTHWRYRK